MTSPNPNQDPKPNLHLKLSSGLALIAWLAAASTLQGCGADSHAGQAAEPYLHHVSTEVVRLQPGYLLEREFAGEVRAGQASELGFELAGQVTELLVDEGDEIYRGQVLARLDTDLLRSRRDELAAQMEELRAELETTRRDFERVERLSSENLASERERDSLAGRVRVLEASLDRVAATFEANEIRLGKSELKAPFDSRIGARHVDSGVVVDAGTPLFGLVESGAREVRAGVPLAIADRLCAGDTVEVRAGETFAEGRVIQVGAVVNQATRSRAVRVAVGDAWAPGEIAYLRVGVETDTAGAWLADSAVTEGVRGTWVAYVAVPEGDGRATLEPRSVVIHHASAGRLFVSGALHEGDEVVAGGLHRLAPGQKVRTEPSPAIADIVIADVP